MAKAIVEHFFEEAFEKFLKILSKGIPALRIPSFDPLKVPGSKSVSFHESFFVSTEASFSDIVVTGLSTLSPPELHWDGKEKVLSATATTEAVQGKGNYTLKGYATLLPLSGSGNFTYNIDSITVKIGVQFKLGDILKLDPKISVDIEFGHTELHLDNLEGGGIAGATLNRIVNLFGGKIAKNISKNLSESMQDALQKIIDKKGLGNIEHAIVQ